MKQRDPSEPSRLLEDLESIRTLLDEQSEAQPTSPDDQLDIPLLQDVIPAPTAPPASGSHVTPPYSLPPRPADKAHNPFLPYASLAKLAAERMQLDQLMSGEEPPPSSFRHCHHRARSPHGSPSAGRSSADSAGRDRRPDPHHRRRIAQADAAQTATDSA